MRKVIEEVVFLMKAVTTFICGVNQGMIGDIKDGYLTIDSIPYIDLENDYITMDSNVKHSLQINTN